MNLKINLKYWWQRRVRGFDDSVTWNLKGEISKWLLPRLKRFRQIHNGYPSELTEEGWNRIIDKMIFALETEVHEDDDLTWMMRKWNFNQEAMNNHDKKLEKRRREGMFYLSKFFDHLWD